MTAAIADIIAPAANALTPGIEIEFFSLLFGPAQRVQTKRGPMFIGIAAGINLLLQTQQAKMAGLMRAEAGDFDVIAQQVWILRNLVHLSAEELLLEIEAWAPGQIAADF